MRVLFALSCSEREEEKIIQCYKEKYGENLDVTSVYFFKSLIDTVRKSDPFDRIIIHENLEATGRKNKEVFDEYIFKNIDALTDESGNATIIFLCGENRKRDDKLLNKLFNVGIYNILIGDQRTFSRVCELIKNPMTKKDAKRFLEVNVESSTYEDPNKVDEVELRSILEYYTSNINNKEKIISGFDNNLYEQYTIQKLRTIIGFLPATVRDILYVNSDKYRAVLGDVVKIVEVPVYMDQDKNIVSLNNKAINKQIDGKNKKRMLSGLFKNKKGQESGATYTVTSQMDNPPAPVYSEPPIYSEPQEKPNVVVEVKDTEDVVNKDNKFKTIPMSELNISKEPEKVEVIKQSDENSTEDKFKLEVPETLTEETVKVEDFDIDEFLKLSDDVVQEPEELNNVTQRSNEEVFKIEIPEEPVVGDGALDIPVEESIEELLKISIPEEPIMEEPVKVEMPEESIEDLFKIEIPEEAVEEPVKIEIPEEPIEEPVKIEIPEEPIEEPVKIEIPEEPIEEPVKIEIPEESIEDLFKIEVPEEPIEEPVKIEIPEEPIEEPVKIEIPEEPIEEPVKIEIPEEPIEEPVKIEIPEEPMEEPVKIEIPEEPIEEPVKIEIPEEPVVGDDVFNIPMGEEPVKVEIPEESTNRELPEAPEIVFNPLGTSTTIEAEPLRKTNSFSEDAVIVTKESIETPKVEPINPVEVRTLNDNMDEVQSYSSKPQIQTVTQVIEREVIKEVYETPSDYKKAIAFIGSHKVGTTFIINAIADNLVSKGIKTAILDLTKNKDTYKIYAANNSEYKEIAGNSIPNLVIGQDVPLRLGDLSIYTGIPRVDRSKIDAVRAIEKIRNQNAVILVDCDFTTSIDIFRLVNNIFVIQDMDITKILDITCFLRELKVRDIGLDKVEVIINKYIKSMLTVDNIVEAMSYYTNPEMTFVDELLPKNVKRFVIPFDEQNYLRYVEALYSAKLNFNGFSEEFMNDIASITHEIYPISSTANRNDQQQIISSAKDGIIKNLFKKRK